MSLSGKQKLWEYPQAAATPRLDSSNPHTPHTTLALPSTSLCRLKISQFPKEARYNQASSFPLRKRSTTNTAFHGSASGNLSLVPQTNCQPISICWALAALLPLIRCLTFQNLSSFLYKIILHSTHLWSIWQAHGVMDANVCGIPGEKVWALGHLHSQSKRASKSSQQQAPGKGEAGLLGELA